MRNCENCNNPLHESATSRARFCSVRCKEQASNRRERVEVDRILAERKCRVCGASLAGKHSRKALACSKECSVQWFNTIRAEAYEVARRAALGPCERCGGKIPGDRKGATKYCSPECKRLAHAALYRAKYRFTLKERLYGLTEAEYESLLIAQDNRCAICRTDYWSGINRVPHIDHDHVTGVVRGLLCGRCNTGLGQFQDDIARLQSAIDYLSR